MCGAGALALTTFAISAASTAMQYYESQQNAAAMEASAEAAYDADKASLDAQAEQMNDQATTEKLERQRQATREQSRIIASNSESGGLGGSFLQQMANSRLQSGYDQAIMETNRKNNIAQNTASKKAAGAKYRTRMNEAASTRMNPFMAGLQIVGAGAESYSGYKTNKKSGIYN